MGNITKEEAIEICRSSYMKIFFRGSVTQWNPTEIMDNPPAGCHLPKDLSEKECWFIPCPPFGSRPTLTWGTPVVGVSKKTGEIVFSGIVGK